MSRTAALCRQATFRGIVLALFAWVAIFSVLFHYHPCPPGTPAPSLAIVRHVRSGLDSPVAAEGPRISQARAFDLDCPICARGGTPYGLGAVSPAAFRPGSALEARDAPPVLPSKKAALIARPRAPPSVLV